MGLDKQWIWVRHDRAVKTKVIGLWARGQKEPWWLATDSKDSLADVVALYDRRMAIEQQIRDTKGCRFGVKLEWTQFKKPQYLSISVCVTCSSGISIMDCCRAGCRKTKPGGTVAM